jgi:hypothetical protein
MRAGFLVIIAFLLYPVPALADLLEVHPLFIRNQAPFVQIFGLPPAEGGRLSMKGITDARLVFDAANIFTGAENGQEEVRVDGETYRLSLAVRHGLSERLEIGVDVPYVWHSGGRLDGFINGFHRTFNLPEGGRNLWYDDQILYLSVCDGEIAYRLDEAQDGFGDVILTAGVRLLKPGQPGRDRSLALRPALKLPTGDERKLTGSGSTDFSLRLAGTDPATLARWRITSYGSLGALAMTEGEVLPRHQRNLVGFGTLGFGWSPLRWLAINLQFDGHTSFYEGTGLHHLDDPSLLITLGTSLALPGKVLADLAVSEDLIVETAPDVMFHVTLRRRF